MVQPLSHNLIPGDIRLAFLYPISGKEVEPVSAQTATFTKKYATKGGVLIIDSVFSKDRSRADVIREILETSTCLVAQSPYRSTVDCGSPSKEAAP